MSETVARQRPPVDLDDFERRFRQTQRPAHEDDPLAELARIVGDEPDPYGAVFAQPAAPAHQDFRPSFAPHGRQEPSFGDDGDRHGDAKARFMADFAAIEAGLRGAATQPADHGHPHQDQLLHPQVAPGHDMQQDYAEPDYAFPPEAQAQADWAEQGHSAPDRLASRKRRALKPATVIAGSIAIAVVGIGVAFAYKGTGSSPREITTIMAAAGPTKIQPPADAKADAADQDAAGQNQTAPTKLVSREEQPVDLQQAVQDNAARDQNARGTDASSVPVPGQPEGTMSPDYSAMDGAKGKDATASAGQPYGDQGFGVGMPAPKKVKSVMVKPDGTIVSGSQDDAAAAAPAPAKVDDRIGALVDGTTSAAPSKSHAKAAKTTTRVATAEPTPAPESIDEAAATPAKPTPTKTTAKKTKPVKLATAETGTEQTANDAGDEAKPAGAGTFAVQLAAPGSEADARAATTRLLKKYSEALHGRRLGFHRADSNGKTVYRVRVSSLTKEDATSLCSKLKAGGGSCFVARN